VFTLALASDRALAAGPLGPPLRPPPCARPLPGRFFAASFGVSVNPSLGHATLAPPDLLLVSPELQLSWGMQIGGAVLLFTRLDLVGAMIPITSAGVGVELGIAWAPGLGQGHWAPLIRASGGLFAFGSGGEALGPDYDAAGFRLGLEVGAFLWPVVEGDHGVVGWGIVAGVQATGLTHVGPCAAGDDCSDALIGPSLRVEGTFLF
jgi:hypothetical protein